MTNRRTTPQRRLIVSISSVLLVSSFAVTSERDEKAKEDWLPLECKAHRTVGLHDYDDIDEIPIELYEARIFLSSEFSIVENRTFSQLLDEPDVAMYLTLTPKETTEQHEYSCKRVKGHGSRGGYSCTNIPPTDILTIDPKTRRFSRASTGAWTLYTSDDTGVGASVFVEVGTCKKPDLHNKESQTSQNSSAREKP